MLEQVMLAKPFVYFGVLVAAALVLRSPDGERPKFLRLALLGFARAVIGLAVGVGAFFAINDVTDNSFATVAAIGLTGFGLWTATGRLAFRRVRPIPLLAFALLSEVVSLGMDWLIVSHLNIH